MSLWQIGGALLGGLLGGKDSKSEKTSEQSPWGPAQPWIQRNIVDAQNLQDRYQQTPFSQPQLQAYQNQFDLSNQFRGMSNSLMQQMTARPQFNRHAPLNRPTPYNFNGAGPVPGASVGGSGMGPFSFAYDRPAASIQQAIAASQQQQQQWDGGRGGGGDGYNGGGAFGYSTGLNGIMNGPFGIGVGMIANAFDPRTNNAPVTDIYGRTPGQIQGGDSDGGFGGNGGYGGVDGAGSSDYGGSAGGWGM